MPKSKKNCSLEIERRELNTIFLDSNNPRSSKEETLDLLALSLRKLGFVLPLYIREDGVILSGHQRFFVAKSLGFKTIPCLLIKKRAKMKNMDMINVYHNKVTADQIDYLYRQSKKKEEGALNLKKILTVLPDNQLGDPIESVGVSSDYTLSMHPRLESLCKKTLFHLVKFYKTYLKYSATDIPIIINNKGQILSGAHRYYYWRQVGHESFPVVVIEQNEAEVLEALLFISMSFDAKKSDNNVLRYSSFRRRYTEKTHEHSVPWPWYIRIPQCSKYHTSMPLHLFSGRFVSSFKSIYGTTIFDLGSGKPIKALQDVFLENGIKISNFEPFLFDDTGKNLDVHRAREFNLKFIDDVRNVYPDTIMSNYNLNSIPFDEDRQHFLALANLLCGEKTEFVVTVRWINTLHQQGSSKGESGYIQLSSSESWSSAGSRNVDIGAKYQKFFRIEELKKLLLKYFINCRFFVERRGYIMFICDTPVRLNDNEYVDSINYEFNTPYPNGLRLGLNESASHLLSRK